MPPYIVFSALFHCSLYRGACHCAGCYLFWKFGIVLSCRTEAEIFAADTANTYEVRQALVENDLESRYPRRNHLTKIAKMCYYMPTFSLRDRFAYRKWTSKLHLVCFTIFCRGCSLYVAKCLAKVAGRRKAENAGNLRWCKVGFGQ